MHIKTSKVVSNMAQVDATCWNCRVPLHVDNDMILVDLSYYVFYRYYATYNWFKTYMKLDVNKDDILKQPLFMEKYNKIFERTLCDIVKQCRVAWGNVILVKDCMRESIWRNKHFGAYKATREERLDTFNKDIFWLTYNELVPKLKKQYGFQVISHDSLEADDVIALLKTEIRKYNCTTTITIITNDNDYVQLVDANTVVKNLQKKEIVHRVGCEPKLYLRKKIIMGDKSDNIPCIMKKIGPKTAEKLATDQDALDRIFDKHPEAKTQYDLNSLLIDLSLIPEDLGNSFKSRVEIMS